jgi:VWFA-related protein
LKSYGTSLALLTLWSGKEENPIMIRYKWSLAGFAWMVMSAWASAQGAPADPAPVVGDAIDVRVVNVEVVVTDWKGRRVTDLKPGDFRLKVDGRTVPVEYFTEVRDGRATATAGEAAVPGAGPGETIGTQYLVFIDDFFSLGFQRDVVLASLKKDLGSLGPADRMSIVDWDGGRLARLADWSASREDLALALDRARARPSRGITQRVALETLREEQRGLGLLNASHVSQGADDQLDRILGSNPGLSLSEIAYGQVLAAQLEGAASAVISAMRGSAPPPGRKVLLLLSGGWPFSLQDYVQPGGSTVTRELPESLPALKALADTANLLGYTLYPIDVPGLTSRVGNITFNPMDGHPAQVFGADYGNPADNPRPTVLTPMDTTGDWETEGTLLYLARETGGKPLLNGNREQALSLAGADTRSYYWLGFTPTWQRDDGSHKVRIEITRRGLKARSRRGFLDLSRPAEVAMKIDSAVLFGELPDGKPLGVRLGTPVKARGKGLGVTEIPVTLDIPASAVTLLQASDGRYQGRAELRLAALDDQGNQSTAPPVRIDLSSARAPSEAGLVRYETKIFLRGRASRVVAALYDPVSGEVSAGRVDVPGL